MKIKHPSWKRKLSFRRKLTKMLKCICSGEHLIADEMIPSSESLATRDYSASGFSSRAGEADTKADASTIEQAESTLRESGFLNYEEARALLGRLEFQKGNTEAALRVFEGIDVAAVTTKIRISLIKRCELPRLHSFDEAPPPMSMHAVSLLFEAILLKARSLSVLGRFAEAAQSCKVILETVESAVPHGLTENFATDSKLLDVLNKAVELLPELWKLAHAPEEAILSYRKALLYQWNLDLHVRAKLEKEFAVFLLYSGTDASPPTLRCQTDGCFVPRNNIEEAILLLLILLRKIVLMRVGWDPSILDHLYFAFSISGEYSDLARYIEELPPNTLLGISLSAQSQKVASDSQRISRQSEALQTLETAKVMTNATNSSVLFYLSLENAEQRKLDIALYYVTEMLKLEAGSDLRGWILLARILSAQKRYVDAEDIINAALEETGKWDQGELLRTKAKLQIAQGNLKDAIGTFSRLLALLHVQKNNFGMHDKLLRNRRNCNRSLEMKTWHDLAYVYTSLCQWRDAEVCLVKSEAINSHSASRLHCTGSLCEARGLHNEALKYYKAALDMDPNHVPSLISIATLLQQFGDLFFPIVKSYLSDALNLDRTNPSAWYSLGLLHKHKVGSSALEAAECFEAAALLQESMPVQPFR